MRTSSPIGPEGPAQPSKNSLMFQTISRAFREAVIYTSERSVIQASLPAILPADLPSQQETTAKVEIEVSPEHNAGRLVIELAERMPTWAEHSRQWTPINNALTPPEVNQFAWRAESGTMQSYRHTDTGRHIHIDGSTGRFYNQDRVEKLELVAVESIAVADGEVNGDEDKGEGGEDRGVAAKRGGWPGAGVVEQHRRMIRRPKGDVPELGESVLFSFIATPSMSWSLPYKKRAPG